MPPLSKGSNLRFPMFNWATLRAAASEDGNDLITDFSAAYDFNDIVTTSIPGSALDLYQSFGSDFGSLDICFYSSKNSPNTYTPLANDTFGFQLWGWRAGRGGPGFLLCASTSATACILGSMIADVDPVTGTALTAGSLWADTLDISTYWPGDCTVYDSEPNRAAILRINNTAGLRFLKCYVYRTDGTTANEANNIAACMCAM